MPDGYNQLADALQGFHRTMGEFARHLQRHQEMSMMAMMVTGCVAEEPGITISEMARRLGMSKSHASSLVEGLTHKGILTKEPDPQDKRLLHLYMSEQGKVFADAAYAGARKSFMDLIGELPEEVAQRLAIDMQALNAVLARSLAEKE